MVNGYDAHSLEATGLGEVVSSSDATSMIAVRGKRFTRNGIGFRSQSRKVVTPVRDDYPGGVAERRRGQIDERTLAWQTSQEVTSPQIRPRDTLPPSGLREALPSRLRGEGDEGREALPPWLRDKMNDDDDDGGDRRKGDDMEEAPLNAKRRNALPDSAFALPGRRYPIDTPERARSALARVEQFGTDEEKQKVRAAVRKKYPDMKVE